MDNGRVYAKILATSSRVFYDKEFTPDSPTPYVVYPSRTTDDDWQLKVALDNTPIKALKDIENSGLEGDSDNQSGEGRSSMKLDELSRENDIFSRREMGSDSQRFKPAKIRPADNLPTYTVTHEYVTNNFDNLEEDQPKSFRPRLPKIFKPQAKASVQRKLDLKPLATVTYHGFAEFTTTVGETVIVFSPSTSPAPIGRPATTIKGDATLRPDDGIAVVKIRPTSVIIGQEKTKQHPGRTSDPRSETGDPLLDAINRANIQPSITEEFEESSTTSTEPLLLIPDVETDSVKPTGLLKVLDSTTSQDGTTTHYKSLIYGTYIGTNYAQIIHTSSNVYFFPDEATATYDAEDTTMDYGTTATESDEEQDTTLQMTTGTTPRIITTSEEVPPEMNELTTPFKDTTDSALTTLKDILESARRVVLGTTESIAPTLDDEIPNDIVRGDPQGRSIKGSSSKNNLEHQDHKEHEFEQEEKISLATRLLPSTMYKTFTYYTTFFIPNGDQTTTSIRSREVVSSDITYLTELILPSETISSIVPTAVTEPISIKTTPDMSQAIEEEQTTKQDEEIELIFKTLYTTYTYLTTFFQESTSSISSREVVETNVITQTVGPNGVSAVVAGLFEKDESTLILPTKISDNGLPSTTLEREEETERYPTTLEQVTEDTLTTLQEQDITTDQNIPTESGIIIEKEVEDIKQMIPEIEPSPTPILPTEEVRKQIKTYYTTYTYYTTIFVDDETEVETRTEVFTNVVTETIQPTAIMSLVQETEKSSPPIEEPVKKPPPEILAYLEAIQRQKSQEEAFLLAKKVQQHGTTHNEESTIVPEAKAETTTEYPSTFEDQPITENLFRGFEVNAQVTPNSPIEGEVLGSMITDVVSSSSSGGGTVLDVMDKRNAVPEDQEFSESNHHDVEPIPTLLLQTSYTTFTYFTTMYKGDESNVVSRLETVTNVVTETIRPTAVVPMETSTLPVTYFTTFTYWTTFYKDGDTITTSREETVSNVITPGVLPTPTVELGVIMTYRPTTLYIEDSSDSLINEKESKVTADNEVTPSAAIPIENSKGEKSGTITSKDIISSSFENTVESTTILPEPTTYYTTYTYYTTSYIGNETIMNSRLETVTSVSIPEVIVTQQQATGRAIDGPVFKQTIATEEKSITPSKTSELLKIGLISTIRSSQVNDGTTTHYMTDIHGTYIDGLYAQVVESSTKVETPSLPSSIATPVLLPTGILSMNKGTVIDADEITTIYFTTKQIGTLLDGLYAKVIESTSSTKINEERKATISPAHGHKTGLVRLIQGQIENNGTTTFYQSKVIGTSIEGRYAQIIESTSSFFSATPTENISPTSTFPPTKPTEIPEISPSPAVIQSSLSEEHTTESLDQDEDSEQNEESEEEDEEGEDGQSSKKKSRLTFSTRKRTFTPVIRPFASRNRPTFNPKRKGAQGATTITRTDITPTITATLAGKGNRFASSRGRVSSPIGPYSSTLSPSGSRRFAGRRGSPNTASSYSSTISGSTRGRPQSRISPSSVFQGNRRGSTSIRGSSARPASRGSSSAFPGASTRYRSPIRPSSTLLRGQSTVKHDDQENDANEFTTTTLITEETPYTDDAEDGETVTTPLQTTTESSKKSTNPLLRFRRPIGLNNSGRTGTTPKSPTTTRRNGNLNRPTSPTLSKVTNTRTNGRNTPISTRPRQSNAGLFPPRSLFGKKQELPIEEQIEPNEDLETEGEENFEDEPVEEIVDNDYEGSEHEDRINRRSDKSIRPTVQIRPFIRRRIRRQASQLRSLTNRFRRPSQSSLKSEEKSDVSENVSSKEEISKSNSKPVARYNNRGRSLTVSRSPTKSSNNLEKTSAESAELNQNKARNRSKQGNNGDRNTSSRIKPTSTSSNGRQFTLREKDGTSSRSSYKRPNSSTSRSNGRSNSNNVRPPRLRNGSNKSSESTSTRRVPPSSRSSSRTSNRNSNRRGSSSRTRGSLEDIREAPTVYPDFDGTITVTHYVPTEVTIPVVNNGITEHRNIITAQPSTEVLSPSQYSTVTGGNGKPLMVIVSEITGTNPQGQTEITRFLLHETPTTRVSYTLTTLGGRRASQSVIVPSTVYSVENVVSTVQPTLPGNAPLANILLSQLLLGQLGQANPLLQPQGTPSTQYNTRTTSYVTTITKQQSTVIPLTFRGKEILTTLVDTSTDIVTATEFITDTVVVTPTAALPAANLNSLLLLLQQPQPQKNTNPLLDPLFAAPPFTQSNTLPGEVERRHQPADSDYKHDSYEYSDEEEDVQEYQKSSRMRNSRGKSNDRKEDSAPREELSVVTLYVSGRRPGEFSTVLSTVKVTDTASSSRKRRSTSDDLVVEVRPSIPPSLHEGSEEITVLAGSEDSLDAHAPTQSLESVVGDVGRHISTSIHT